MNQSINQSPTQNCKISSKKPAVLLQQLLPKKGQIGYMQHKMIYILEIPKNYKL